MIAVARKGEAPIATVAKDFGISESCLHRWLHLDEVEAGTRPGLNREESAESRDVKKRTRLLEQENEVLGRGWATMAGLATRSVASMTTSLVADRGDGEPSCLFWGRV